MLGNAIRSGRWVMAALTLLLLVGVLFAKPAHAKTFTVNSTNHPGTGACDATECTLREAINEANSNGESDTIGFASGLSGEIELSLSNSSFGTGFPIQNDTAAEDLRIDGPGAGVLAIDGNNQARAFTIASGAKATIEGLTIKNGSSDFHGGILNYGNLTVSNSTISGNSSSGIGNNGGTLTVSNSTISGNTSSGGGGGISNGGTGTVTVSNSTISGNTSIFGGGISNGGTLTVNDSTISGNSGREGGGIYNPSGTLRVSNSTISGNSSDFGGGITTNPDNSTATLANTIVAGNSATNAGPDAEGTFTSQGYNLIGTPDGGSGWVGSDLQNVNPRLGPLRNNGGPTHTHALLPGSPAINAIPKGTNDCGTTITTDQRGVKRPQSGKCEIGSFEDISPKVKRVLPAQNATGIGPRANVSAFFSEAMRAGSINTNTIKLYKAGTTTAIGAQVSYDAQKKKAILNPDANLLLGKTYKAVVTTGAKDRAGNRLDQDQDPSNGNQKKVWRFTVRN
jgi:CSLREA domain-containing protein